MMMMIFGPDDDSLMMMILIVMMMIFEEKEMMMRYCNKEIMIGDIFVASWGYGQTNIDAFQVIEKKGKASLIIRAIDNEPVLRPDEDVTTRYQSTAGRCVPVKDKFSDWTVMFDDQENGQMVRVDPGDGDGPFIRVGRGKYFARRWDGKTPFHESW